MQGTWVRFLVQEDSTCYGATKAVCHDCWARVPQLLKPAHSSVPSLHSLQSLCSATRGHHNQKTVYRNKGQPPLTATRESPCKATDTQSSWKKRWEEYASQNCGYFKGKEFSRVGSRVDFYCFFFFVKGHRFKKIFILGGRGKVFGDLVNTLHSCHLTNEESQVSKC